MEEYQSYSSALLELLVKQVDPATWRLLKICKEKLGMKLELSM